MQGIGNREQNNFIAAHTRLVDRQVGVRLVYPSHPSRAWMGHPPGI
jgi:hypothetical protein